MSTIGTKKVVVVKRFGKWIGSCPACSADKGFMAHGVYQLVLMWALSHVRSHRKSAFQYIEHAWTD